MALLLNACSAPSYPSIAKATVEHVGQVPECAKSHFKWMTQLKTETGVLISALYNVSPACGLEWEKRLEADGFIIQPAHGERVKSWSPLLMVASGREAGQMGVIFERARPLEGLKVVEKEAPK